MFILVQCAANIIWFFDLTNYLQAPLPFVTDNDKLDAANKEATTDFGHFRDQPISLKKMMISDFQPTKQREKELEIVR